MRMGALPIVGVGLVIIGLFGFARLALGDDLRALDWYARLARTLLYAAVVCFGAAQLPPAGAPSSNVFGALGVFLAVGGGVALTLKRRRKLPRQGQMVHDGDDSRRPGLMKPRTWRMLTLPFGYMAAMVLAMYAGHYSPALQLVTVIMVTIVGQWLILRRASSTSRSEAVGVTVVFASLVLIFATLVAFIPPR